MAQIHKLNCKDFHSLFSDIFDSVVFVKGHKGSVTVIGASY